MIFTITIGYIIGILIGLYLSSIAHFLILIIFFILFSLYIFLKEKIKKYKILIFAFICFVLLGFFNIDLREKVKTNIKNEIYPLENINKIETLGEIISLEKESEYKKSFEISLNKIVYKEKNIERTINCKNKKIIIKVMVEKDKYKYNFFPGNYIKIEGKYSRSSSYNNFNIFNYEKYLERKDIFGTVEAEKIYLLKENVNLINNFRFKIIEYIENKVNREFEENSRHLNWNFNWR